MSFYFEDNSDNWLRFSEVGSEMSPGTGDFTFMARVRPSNVNYGVGEQGCIYSRDYTALEFAIYQGDYFAYVAGVGGGGNVAISAGADHAVGTRRNGTTVVNFVDGSFGTTTTNSSNVSGSGDCYLGNRPSSSSNLAVEANLQDIGFWLAALTDDEMQSFYKGFPAHRIRPQSLSACPRLQRSAFDPKAGRTWTFGAFGPASSTTIQRTYG